MANIYLPTIELHRDAVPMFHVASGFRQATLKKRTRCCHPSNFQISSEQFLVSHGLEYSLTSAFLHLMHLPNHLITSTSPQLSQGFPLSNFTPSVNLLRLDISYLKRFDKLDENDSSEISLLTTKSFHAKRQDGQSAQLEFNGGFHDILSPPVHAL